MFRCRILTIGSFRRELFGWFERMENLMIQKYFPPPFLGWAILEISVIWPANHISTNTIRVCLNQITPILKKKAWVTSYKPQNNPLSEEQARGIRPDIEELLTSNVNRYYKSKNRQKIKFEANTTSDGSSTLSRLDGFEKQLEERELRVQQRENNIKNTIEGQVAEERKRLKDEYDALKIRLESEYNKCMVDMKQTTYSFKNQLEDQHNSRSADLEKQYKSRISVLEKANIVKDKEIGRLSASLSRSKNEIKDLKHALSSVKNTIKIMDDIIFAKEQAIIYLL
ncbi:unnamed protein product [Rhizophagus irregularis]|nr:unnamed protein product [Rhizophagus irregularis]